MSNPTPKSPHRKIRQEQFARSRSVIGANRCSDVTVKRVDPAELQKLMKAAPTTNLAKDLETEQLGTVLRYKHADAKRIVFGEPVKEAGILEVSAKEHAPISQGIASRQREANAMNAGDAIELVRESQRHK